MRLLGLLTLAAAATAYVVNEGTTCEIYPEALTHNGQAVDDAPSIHQAFNLCGINGTVIFTNNTFHVNSVLNTTNLINCDVSLRGELRFSTNIPYWKSHVFSVIFQNQSTAWLFGGTNVTLRGEGGWINGNGQAWYTQNKGIANQPGRPISITFFNSTNLLVDRLTILQPQFWATHVWQSKNVSLANFFMNATSTDPKYGTINTDGFDSWNSDNIRIINASITTNDDCLAPKGNTTNLYAKNITCYGSHGPSIGSVGQYPQWPDYVQNITFEDIRVINGSQGPMIKTWQGETESNTSNGGPGGGGSGLVKNITFRNVELVNVAFPIQITQCIYTEAGGKYCDTSKMKIQDVRWINVTGTSRYNVAASIYCTTKNPCPGIRFENVDIVSVNKTLGLPMWNTTLQEEIFQCGNIIDQGGSGIPCNRVAPNNFPQGVSKNVQEGS